ncbi:transcription initiation factor IIA large subunit PWA37_001056 [Arxiozyma heterogenica]|uniref:Transcription initiation factor IIA large subunit n=1 Tax=Arxiozyma heterogenica TaxID=278026 RepID=A0AAN7WEW4_9SACH|nr:hypothetical protein RI543_004584 [Kazachstania heterogenica]
MSNREASRIYELIVESVINEVREDFENAGIDEQTLQDLRRNWQLRLSESKVSSFSWDEYSLNNNPVSTNNMMDLNIDNNGNDNTTNTNDILNNENNEISDQNLNNFTIKQENNNDLHPNLSQGLVLPGFDSNIIPAPPTSTVSNTDTTDDNPHNEELPPVKEEEGFDNQSVLPDSLPEQNNTETNTNNASDSIKNSETIKTEDIQKPTDLENAPLITTNGKIELTLENPNGVVEEQLRLQEKKAKRSALLDTDEVGSELDDSDDDYLISEGDDDGPDENLVLCLYDKVTRTKARWKCSLKDGIATINHRDYTFQKAQVEAEWV